MYELEGHLSCVCTKLVHEGRQIHLGRVRIPVAYDPEFILGHRRGL